MFVGRNYLIDLFYFSGVEWPEPEWLWDEEPTTEPSEFKSIQSVNKSFGIWWWSSCQNEKVVHPRLFFSSAACWRFRRTLFYRLLSSSRGMKFGGVVRAHCVRRTIDPGAGSGNVRYATETYKRTMTLEISFKEKINMCTGLTRPRVHIRYTRTNLIRTGFCAGFSTR